VILDGSTVAILITILLALLGVVFGYGVLTNKVNNHGKDIEKLETSYKNIDSKLDAICNDVAAIKSTLRERGTNQH